MAATHRHEEELKQKCKQKAQTEKDPLELLRLRCLERGAAGIKGIGRYVVRIPMSIPLLWWVYDFISVQKRFNSTREIKTELFKHSCLELAILSSCQFSKCVGYILHT